jgi:hypothetical protein
MRVASGPRQLSLWKGKRQRGVAPRPPLEFATQCALADTLRLSCDAKWWWTALPFGEFRTPATANRLQRMGVRGGLPDFVFLHMLGDTCWLELKRGRLGRVSPDQAAMFSYLARRGDTMLMATSYEEAVGMLQDVGILPRTLKVQ